MNDVGMSNYKKVICKHSMNDVGMTNYENVATNLRNLEDQRLCVEPIKSYSYTMVTDALNCKVSYIRLHV